MTDFQPSLDQAAIAPPPAPGSVSACLVVRHEEAVIERCLRSLDGVVDEIVLVHDGMCEDGTLEIAARHGCRVFERPLIGHREGPAVFAYEAARCEWILTIDADEYLSESLRDGLPKLVEDERVNGYEFLWPRWDGERYITENGPYKLALFRRSSTHLLGLIHYVEKIDPPIGRVDLLIEHRPLYNNVALRTVLTKWRRWARINAREFLMPFAELPKFNWEEPCDWPPRRRILNRLSPVLFLPYVPAVFLVHVWRERESYGIRENLHMAFYQGLYAGMVQLYVAKYLYLGAGDDAPAAESPRPGVAPTRPPR